MCSLISSGPGGIPDNIWFTKEHFAKPSGWELTVPTARGCFCSVLSLSARYSDRAELRESLNMPETAGNGLVEQAKAILYFEMESLTTSTVASLDLLALREMSVNKEALGWTDVGSYIPYKVFQMLMNNLTFIGFLSWHWADLV